MVGQMRYGIELPLGMYALKSFVVSGLIPNSKRQLSTFAAIAAKKLCLAALSKEVNASWRATGGNPMCQTTLVVTEDGHVLGVQSWTEGFKPLQCPRKVMDERHVLAVASWFEKRGRREEADEVLEKFLQDHRFLN